MDVVRQDRPQPFDGLHRRGRHRCGGWITEEIRNVTEQLREERLKLVFNLFGDPVPVAGAERLDDRIKEIAASPIMSADAVAAAAAASSGSSVGKPPVLNLDDNDGDAELVLTRQFDTVLFYENRRSKPAAWIGFDVKGDGRAVSADATGAVLELSQGAERCSHTVLNVSGFTAQGDRRVVIGLAGNAAPVEANILWPDGTRQDLGEFESGKYHLIRKADGSADFSRRE